MKDFVKSLYADKRARFLLVGAINTGFSFVIYAILVFWGVIPHIAVVLMYPVSILHGYLWHKYFTFRISGRSLREIFRFVLINLLAFGINYFAVYVTTYRFDMNPYLAGMLAMGITTIVSYLGHNLFTFRMQ